MNKNAVLVLEDGTVFHGLSIGIQGTTVGEVVFNTAITGYQEILTNPSYLQQIVTLTHPHIGNVGVNPNDAESPKIQAAGLVIRELSLQASNWRAQNTLQDYLSTQGIIAIADIDTRRLTRILRTGGAQNGCIMAGDNIDSELALTQAQTFPGLKGLDLAKNITTSTTYTWTHGTWDLDPQRSMLQITAPKYHIVAYDFGIKRNILRMLAARNCRISVVPAQTPADAVLALNPDGIFLSNGPGDPEPCTYAIQAIRQLLETNIPIFGICLGHQLLGLASGANTVKMKFGHHGANHPVQDLNTGSVIITSQNHGFAIDEASLPSNLQATHRSLFDGSLQGIQRTDRPAFGFQGHPEASPGPHDVSYLFDKFIHDIANR
ncbi:carbamoyl phosphate synthase small subunit [Achromatium sp. WMS2]|nr:carbamoyl phosphate synthase small subunit [Achromatium sp. WMS2]